MSNYGLATIFEVDKDTTQTQLKEKQVNYPHSSAFRNSINLFYFCVACQSP